MAEASTGLTLDRLVYGARQAARVSWFSGQKMIAARMSRPVPLPEALRGRAMPDNKRVLADLRALLAQDWRNIEAGLYRAPEMTVAGSGQALDGLRRMRAFFADLAEVEARRHGPRRAKRLSVAPEGRYPRYYLQSFHDQTDGYLSDASAELYDYQVEVLFGGGGGAMRRQALVPLRQALAGRDIRRTELVDIACGTGSFLREVKLNYPRLRVTGLDLSTPYLEAARRQLAPWSRTELVEGAAEAMPFANGRFDVATCVYLFHELPPRTRREVAREIARILKPGGVLIFVDSVQTGDLPDYDAMLDYFPVALHEPFYSSYLGEDLDALFGQAGFAPEGSVPAYLSKVRLYRRI